MLGKLSRADGVLIYCDIVKIRKKVDGNEIWRAYVVFAESPHQGVGRIGPRNGNSWGLLLSIYLLLEKLIQSTFLWLLFIYYKRLWVSERNLKKVFMQNLTSTHPIKKQLLRKPRKNISNPTRKICWWNSRKYRKRNWKRKKKSKSKAISKLTRWAQSIAFQ